MEIFIPLLILVHFNFLLFLIKPSLSSWVFSSFPFPCPSNENPYKWSSFCSSGIFLCVKSEGWVLASPSPRNCCGADTGEQPLVQTHRCSEHQHGNRFFSQNWLEKRLGTVVLLWGQRRVGSCGCGSCDVSLEPFHVSLLWEFIPCFFSWGCVLHVHVQPHLWHWLCLGFELSEHLIDPDPPAFDGYFRVVVSFNDEVEVNVPKKSVQSVLTHLYPKDYTRPTMKEALEKAGEVGF